MTPHVVETGDVPLSVFELFNEMRTVLEALPDLPKSETISCHTVCELFSRHYPVIHKKGFFAEKFDHSWLISCESPDVLMDMYPVAGGSSLIVYTGMNHLPWNEFYQEGQPTNYDVDRLEKQVKELEQFLT